MATRRANAVSLILFIGTPSLFPRVGTFDLVLDLSFISLSPLIIFIITASDASYHTLRDVLEEFFLRRHLHYTFPEGEILEIINSARWGKIRRSPPCRPSLAEASRLTSLPTIICYFLPAKPGNTSRAPLPAAISLAPSPDPARVPLARRVRTALEISRHRGGGVRLSELSSLRVRERVYRRPSRTSRAARLLTSATLSGYSAGFFLNA